MLTKTANTTVPVSPDQEPLLLPNEYALLGGQLVGSAVALGVTEGVGEGTTSTLSKLAVVCQGRQVLPLASIGATRRRQVEGTTDPKSHTNPSPLVRVCAQ